MLSLLLGFAFGVLTWAAQHAMSGEAEIDAFSPYFLPVTALAGAVATLVYPRAFWPGPIGLGLGQLVYLSLLPGTFHPLGMAAVVVWGLAPSLAGAIVVHVGWRVLRENMQRDP